MLTEAKVFGQNNRHELVREPHSLRSYIGMAVHQPASAGHLQ